MAKAMTVFLLLAATAAIAAAHPGLGKGFAGAVNINGTADASKTITISKDKGTDLSNCQCKDDCKSETVKKCKEVTKEVEVCKDEEGEEDVVVCETKCFKADKVISIGKGRRMMSANGLIGGIAKAAILSHAVEGNKNETETGGQQQEICREICKDKKKPTVEKKCKKEKKTDLVDCKEEVVSTRCVKNCLCGEKTITISKGGPDFGDIAAAVIGSHGKGH